MTSSISMMSTRSNKRLPSKEHGVNHFLQCPGDVRHRTSPAYVDNAYIVYSVIRPQLWYLDAPYCRASPGDEKCTAQCVVLAQLAKMLRAKKGGVARDKAHVSRSRTTTAVGSRKAIFLVVSQGETSPTCPACPILRHQSVGALLEKIGIVIRRLRRLVPAQYPVPLRHQQVFPRDCGWYSQRHRCPVRVYPSQSL